MKIKIKKIILLAFTLLITSSLVAQEEEAKEENSKFFISAKVGIKFPIGITTEEAVPLISIGRVPDLSLGSGYETELNFGYLVNNKIDLEMGVSYFFNDKPVTLVTENYDNGTNEKYSINIIQLKPSVVLKTQGTKLKGYIKTGFNIGVYRDIKNEYIEERKTVIKSLTFSSTKSDLPLGFHSAIGFEYRLKKKIILFTEFSLNVLKIKNIIYDYKENFFIFAPPNSEGFPNSPYSGNDPFYEYYDYLRNYSSRITVANYGFDFGIKYNL